jgi:hypothetical protein
VPRGAAAETARARRQAQALVATLTVRFLTEEWRELFLREAADLPGLPDATGAFEVLVSRAGGTTGAFVMALVDGHVSDVTLGSPATPADVRVELSEADVIRLFEGNVDPVYQSYWSGRLRATGDMEKTLAIAPLLDTDAFRALLRRVLDATEFV